MSQLLEKLNQDLVKAQKARDAVSVSTLRFLLSAVKNREIELRTSAKELSDDEVLSVISKQAKQRQESIQEFTKANRLELAQKEESELKILQNYLPEQANEDEVRKIIEAAIRECGAGSIKDTGKVMGLVMPKLKGRADGSVIGRIVKEKLSV